MAITGTLTDIPEHILEVVKTCPGVMRLFHESRILRNESPIGSIRKLPYAIAQTLRDIYSETPHEVGKTLSLHICESIYHYQQTFPAEFSMVSRVIPEIVRTGQSALQVDLGRYWQLVTFLFSGVVRPDLNVLLIENRYPFGINPLDYRKSLLDSALPIHQAESWYLPSQEVQAVASHLRDFGRELVARNLECIQAVHSSLYWIQRHTSTIWNDETWRSHARDLCDDVITFYCHAADRGRAVLIAIG